MDSQPEDNFFGKGGEEGADQTQQRGSVSLFNRRRAGSSWNRGRNSAWNLRGRGENLRGRGEAHAQRVKDDTARSGGTDSEAPTYESREEELYTAERVASPTEEELKISSTTGHPHVHLQIKKEREYFNVDGSVETVVDPDTLYGIITDYNSNARVFRNVDRVEVEDKGSEKLVTQFLHWNFLMWSGNYDIKMKIKNDPQTRSISYELAQPGFLKIFNGSWTVEPLSSEGAAPSSKLILKQHALPSYYPSGPLAVGAGSYASRIMSNQVTNLLADVATEAYEVKKRSGESS